MAYLKELDAHIDHFHLTAMIPPKLSAPNYTGILKGRTARALKPKKNSVSVREAFIILLLFAFCTLIVLLGNEDLYDLVRNCITGVLVMYLGWKSVSRSTTDEDESKGQS